MELQCHSWKQAGGKYSKAASQLGDTYTLDISDPGDEIMALMLVIAIDAANCSQNNN